MKNVAIKGRKFCPKTHFQFRGENGVMDGVPLKARIGNIFLGDMRRSPAFFPQPETFRRFRKAAPVEPARDIDDPECLFFSRELDIERPARPDEEVFRFLENVDELQFGETEERDDEERPATGDGI